MEIVAIGFAERVEDYLINLLNIYKLKYWPLRVETHSASLILIPAATIIPNR